MRIATRGSRLALRQVELVARRLGIDVEPVVVSTAGDRSPDVPLRAIAGTGAFTGDVRDALDAGAADLAVHSAKDLPADDDQRFRTAYPERADPRDALVGATVAGLAWGATVATGAPRRRAQLAARRPDLCFAELRGNIDTRLAKAASFDGIIVAAAALHRLGIAPAAPVELLPVDDFVPQVGQGVLAVDARRGDRAARALLGALDDPATRRAASAERAFLATLGGDCDLPAGAHATVGRTGAVRLRAVLADTDGRLLRAVETGADPLSVGASVAHRLQSELDAAARTGRTVA